uniref:Uncharacterized protein n=1 Tax=Tetradesmus obliquus TaxID=3088 RepID=A0A383VQZ6_TETOB|eukprot:jgi/Sobl393_1/14612/SZX67323.1
MQSRTCTFALLFVAFVAVCDCISAQQPTKKPPPVASGQQQKQQQQQQQQASTLPSASTKPSSKLVDLKQPVKITASSGQGQPEQAQLYECVLCSKPVGGGARAAAASASAQQQAVAALQAVGIQVNGRFGIQASVRMTARQAASKAVQDNCCYTVRSMAAHG